MGGFFSKKNSSLNEILLVSSRDETRPGMKKFLFTREFHPGMRFRLGYM